jgi:hypothetical protein
MIGGTDVTFPTKRGTSALDLCLRTILREWPKAFFEDALTEAAFDDYTSVPLESLSEVFVFRDRDVAHEWEERGYGPDLENTMIHIKLSDSSVTLVVDDPSEPIVERILGTIRDGLGGLALNGPAGPTVPLPQTSQAHSPDSTPQSGPK